MMESAPFNFRRIIIWLGRLALGPIFLYAGYSKIFLPNRFYWPLAMLKFSVAANLSNFGFQVESYKLLSPAAGVTRAYLLHMNINCGCFAVAEPVSIKKILEDSAMLLLALLMTVFAYQESRRPHPWAAPEKSAA